ncbi:MAG: hypothetical protein JSV20_05680 [Candidatus Bathyarchaeota archaeon]|nr:MAG: hypothetical protein JSV20_05680 [Candidatus Bathyarchaeota archaeon]
MTELIFIIPCSGIGKAFGTISREATYQVVEDLRKGETDTLCLSLLVIGDEDSNHLVQSHRCIAIDGCPLECAKKNLQLAGAKLTTNFRVVDLLKEHQNLKPKNITFLDQEGRELAKLLADQIAAKIDELNRGEIDS